MNKTFDFLLSGINSLVKLGKGGNSLKSEKDSHIEFLSSALELLPVRTKNPVDPKDSVNLEFLRENVLLNFGLPVQNLSELSSIPSLERRDKQIRYVEDIEAFYQFDGQSIAIAPNPDIPDLVILPDGIDPSFPGRWIKTKARIQFHSELIGNDLGDDHPQYQLRTEKDQPTGYVGKDSFGNINSNTDELAEGTSNLYFTGERARSESVENTINELEEAKAPSQRAVSLALSGKEDEILPSDVDKFLNGLKEFVSITIGNVVGLAEEISDIYDSINSLSISLGNLISVPSQTSANEFLNGLNQFAEILISNVQGLDSALDNISLAIADKENNLPSGSAGQYLHSDKTFKQINYSDIGGTPPGGSSPTIITNLDTTLTPGFYTIILPPGSIFFAASVSSIECIVEVVKGVNAQLVQYLYVAQANASITYDRVFMRKYIGAVWLPWQEILSTSSGSQLQVNAQARLNAPVGNIPSFGAGNVTLNCLQYSYAKKTGGASTITLSNMGILQTFVLEVASTGSAYALTFASSPVLPFRWENQTQPTPTTTAGRFDIYTFLNFENRIQVLVALNQG